MRGASGNYDLSGDCIVRQVPGSFSGSRGMGAELLAVFLLSRGHAIARCAKPLHRNAPGGTVASDGSVARGIAVTPGTTHLAPHSRAGFSHAPVAGGPAGRMIYTIAASAAGACELIFDGFNWSE